MLDALVTEHDVVGDTHHRYQLKVLVDHANPEFQRSTRGFHHHRHPIDPDLTTRRTAETKDDVHQGRFPGTVFAQKSENLTFVECKINIFVRNNTGKDFRDVVCFEHRCGRVAQDTSLLDGNSVETSSTERLVRSLCRSLRFTLLLIDFTLCSRWAYTTNKAGDRDDGDEVGDHANELTGDGGHTGQ